MSGSTPNLIYTPNHEFIGKDTFTYLVYDGKKISAPAIVTINVVNTAPTADAGQYQIGSVGQLIQLDGSASEDINNDALTFHWQLIETPAESQASLINEGTAFPTIVMDKEGIYVIQLVVNDGILDSYPDTVKVASKTMILDAIPDKISLGTNNVVYILSTLNEKVYRWSLIEDFPMTPIDIDGAAHLMAYSAADHRLYLGYESGAITQIALNSGTQEAPFASTPLSPHGLAIAGDYVLAADASGVWNTHYIFDRDGILITSVDYNRRSSEYAWNPVNSRIYFFRDGIYPNDLHYEEIDQTTGLITDSGETPYHGSYTIKPPIRVSIDGTTVLLGSGDMYDADSMEYAGSLTIEPVDAMWMSDGLLTLRPAPDGRTLLEQWSSDYTLYGGQYFEGVPLRVFEWSQGVVVITLVDGHPTFFTYVPTNDADNDGVINSEDVFPLDPAASIDTDGDGYPDVWNPEKSEADSTTGLILDSFPYDSACQLPEHGLPDDPTVCDIANGIPDYTPDQVVLGRDNVVCMLSTANEKIYRWSLDLDYHLKPIDIDGKAQLMAYSAVDHRLYLGYDSGTITRINLDSGTQEAPFATTPLSPHGLACAGAFVLAADSQALNTHYVYASDGTLMTSVDWNAESSEYAWNPFNSRIYFLNKYTYPENLYYEEIDQVTGLITASGETPYYSEYIIEAPIRVAKDGTIVLLGSGDMYDADSMEFMESLPIDPVDAVWMNDGLLTIRVAPNGGTLVEQWRSDYTLYRGQYFEGEPLRVFEYSQGVVVITLVDDQPAFSAYVPMNDNGDDDDGDGVINSEDSFPIDPAASIDTDGDGYPDVWNPGKNEADSTTGLILDSFPNDSACQLPEHGLPENPTVCNIAGSIPDYTPDQVILGSDNVVYMLSTDNWKIYRWSLDQDDHLNPINIDGAAHLMAYSAADHCFYLGYDSGPITRIDLNSGIQESPFVSTLIDPDGLAVAGAYLVANDAGASYSKTQYVLDSDGTFITSSYFYDRPSEYAWNPVNSRIYYIIDFTSYNNLYYEEIDQTTGLIASRGATPYHLDFEIKTPIRISNDGRTVLLGSGDMYDADSMELVASLPIEPVDAAWMSEGLLTLRTAPDGSTLLEQWRSDYTLYNAQYFDGEPLRVFEWLQGIVVITLVDGQPSFFAYVPTNDSDDDDVINSEDAFPLDPAASVDTDGDGYPDAWNPGKSDADSTTGLILDSFPNDSACQLPGDGLPGDPTICDIANSIPDYIPDQVVLGSDNVFYMLSTTNERIYRWSLDQDDHLNPIDIDGAANLMAYTNKDHRLYLSYDNGAITRIDLNIGIQESHFATTPLSPHGLAIAGDYVLAADESGSPNFHYVFDLDGTLVANIESKGLSSEYEWNPVNNRIYFFRDGTVPNDLHYEEIDQITGLITATGETPYHGEFSIKPPIRVSKDGTTVLLGSGDRYDADSMEFVGSMPIEPVDAAWISDGLLTLRAAPDGRTLLEQWRSDYTLYNAQYFDGEPLRVFEWLHGFVVITLVNGQPAFFAYEPTNDGDNDGVINSEDAFPLDPAASVDTDGDGYPDDWNPGESDADSTTGLILDSFPNDSACQLPEHGLSGDPTVCDIANSIPDYMPDEVMLGSDNVVYMLSADNEKIYRWSLDQNYYLNPIYIDGAARLMAYSAADYHLYLGYDSGAVITRIDLNGSIQESFFATTLLRPHGLVSVGDYLLAADRSGSWNTHYIFDLDGTLITSVDLNVHSTEFVWNTVNSRMYYFSSAMTPDDLYYEEIDQITGLITDSGKTLCDADYTTEPLIRFSVDGTKVLLGSGDIHDADTLEYKDSLPVEPVDATWMSEGLLTIRTAGDGSTLLEQWSADNTVYNIQYFDGEPLRIFRWSGGFAVITFANGRPSFFTYAPTDDGDEDGVLNSEDAFPLDPAASMDTDGDGYPDEWNTGYSVLDSTTGLVLDSFPYDLGCQLPEHGIEGECDFNRLIPESEEFVCETDEVSGIVESGTTNFNFTVSDFVPLCSGWLIVTDTLNNKIKIINAFDKRIGVEYGLTSTPQYLLFDDANKTLYATTEAAGEIVKINLVERSIFYLSIGDALSIVDMAHGPNETLLVKTTDTLMVFSKTTDNLLGTWPMEGSMIVFNSSRNEIISAMQGVSPSSVYRYSFTLSEGVDLLQSSQELGSNGRDLDLSPDNNHLAFAVGGGNGGSDYTIYDIDPSDLNSSNGTWDIGAHPESVAFSLNSDVLVTKNDYNILIYSVVDYFLLETLAISTYCNQVEVSRGNRIGFALSEGNYYQPQTSNIEWLIYQ